MRTSSKLALRALAGAVALAVGGTAMANTMLDALTTGDIFLNVVDQTKQTSFLYDTGVAQASFNPGQSLNFNVSSDANYLQFLTNAGSDPLDYSVLSGTKQGSPLTATALFTASGTVSPGKGADMGQALAKMQGFLNVANTVASSTTNSALLDVNSWWGQAGNEGGVTSSLGGGIQVTDSAAPGTALNFYSETSSNLRSSTIPAILSQEGGTWDFLNGQLTYAPSVAAVPEASTWAMMMLGFAGLGFLSYRRTQRKGGLNFRLV